MALGDELEDIVGLITGYLQDGRVHLIDQFGDQAPALADEVVAILEEVFQSETPFAALWDEYRMEPASNEAELIGALEVLEETMPGLTMRLEGYLAAFQELDREGVTEIIESSEPEDTLQVEEVAHVKSNDDMDNNDEYREDNTYLVGNVEDHSTSAMYIEGLDTDVEPNQSETGEDD